MFFSKFFRFHVKNFSLGTYSRQMETFNSNSITLNFHKLEEWLSQPLPTDIRYNILKDSHDDLYMLGTYDRFHGASEDMKEFLKKHGFDAKYNFLSNFFEIQSTVILLILIV